LTAYHALRKPGIRGIICLPMTQSQEEALYDFLDNVTEPFDLGDVVSYIRKIEAIRNEAEPLTRVAREVEFYINSRKLAFSDGEKRWVSRRAFFEPLSFVINPSRLELVNGIFIPGHRCVPFANTSLLPQEYVFFSDLFPPSRPRLPCVRRLQGQ